MNEGTYEAYCLDEAVVYFGSTLEHMLETAGHKPSKEERRAQAARQALMNKVLADEDDKKNQGSGFADPALIFK